MIKIYEHGTALYSTHILEKNSLAEIRHSINHMYSIHKVVNQGILLKLNSSSHSLEFGQS